jgi:hypothetical protein
LNQLAKFVFSRTRFFVPFRVSTSGRHAKIATDLPTGKSVACTRLQTLWFGDQRWMLCRIRVRGDAVLISAQIPGSSAAAYPAVKAPVIWATCVGRSGHAFGKDGGGDDSPPKSTVPTMYVDLQSTYTLAPGCEPGSRIGEAWLFTILQSIALAGRNTLPAVQTNARPPSVQALAIDIPLAVDVSDRVSIETVLSTDAQDAALSATQLTQGWGRSDPC